MASFYQNENDAKALYDSVIIVNDRRLLNKQIQNNIRQLDNTPGLVSYIDENNTSQDLKKAIEEGKRIIVTTLQRFPVISDTIANMPERKYAVIIDEAHSSQSGESARHLKKSLSLEEAEKQDVTEDLDDIIADEIKRKGKQPNISFFAFTATPKPKTEELFGRLKDGKIKAFDSYTMEQAIKEGFIRDVLKNYMSFKRYYKIIKRLDIDDKEYEKKKTVRLLGSYVDLQDHAIERKARIMIEHFVSQTQNEIQGKARAMVVTKSRLHAVRFKRKFDEIMQEMKLPYGALVAFSGTVKDSETNEEYTETSMNQLQGKISIPEALKLPQFRILIVANKFQTGFDEPMLHTMFVDKKLGLFELAHQLAQLQQRGHIDPITTPVPAQVTLRQRVLQEGGRGGGRTQVEHQVKTLGLRRGVTGEVDGTRHLAHLHTVAVRAAGRHVDLVIEADGVLGAGRHTGVAAGAQVQVNGVVGLPLQLKRTQPAGKARNAPTQHGKTPRLRTTRIAGALGEQGHIQHIRHQGGSLFGLVERANDEQAARALVSDRGHGRWIRQAGGGQQRGDLGAGLGGIAAPATGFADVHKPDGRHRAFGLLAQIAKQALLLGASHHHIVTRLDGLLKGPRLAAAQGGVECQVFMQRRAQRLRVEGHRLVAVADERRGHVLCGWLAGPPHPYGGGRPSQARWRGR